MLKIVKCNIQLHFFRQLSKQPNREMKYLNVAEKNDAAKTISGLLSNGTARRREGYSVYNKIYDFDCNVKGRNCKMVMTSVSGHLLNLAFPISYRNWNSIDPQTLFDAPVIKKCSEDFMPIKRTLEREIRGCQGLIIWTDCDREGENIGFEIVEVCREVKPRILLYRAVFSEITALAVHRALSQLREPDKRQSDAVDVRSEIDLRTGAAITRFQTLRLSRLFPAKMADKLISYGSCQIPTLGFVAERYKEIEAFVSEPFWKLKVTHTIDDLTVEFNWARNRLFDKQACEDYLIICLADPKATVENVSIKPKSKWRPTPLDTVEMEKLGSRKLKLSAKEVMTIAEKLYTKGIISYPRTETNQFSKDIDLRLLVEQHIEHSQWGTFAQRIMEWGPNPRNGNKSDQAHPPIHPLKLVTNLEGKEASVYELITRHFLACVSKDATGSETIVNINIAGEKFTATGLCIYERNYLDIYIYDKWSAKQIHKYEQGQIFDPTEITMHEGATTAPPLLTEADLIALMEKHGIGTDATHAEHINTIKERGYIGVVDKGFLVPGVIGMGLYEGYNAMELALAKPVLRAEFESDLKKICLGEKDPKLVLREQVKKYKEAYGQILEKITALDTKMAVRINETLAPTTSDNTSQNNFNHDWENNPNRIQDLFQCPKCAVAPLALKPKKNQSGYFIGCLNFPDCKNVIWLPDECKKPIVILETCSRCGDNAKLLKFKFNSAYYKVIFNTPSGWYKTCLRCDALFRNTFNINLDAVKRIGAIVSNVPDSTTSTISETIIPSASSTLSDQSSTRANSISVNQNMRNNTKKPKTQPTTESKSKDSRKKTTVTTLRSYFTAAYTADILRKELNGATIDDFFDSNDSFDNAIRDLDTHTAKANLKTHTVNNNNNNSHQQRLVSSIELPDDVGAIFENDDFEDDNWGTTTSNTAKNNQNEIPLTSNNNSYSLGTCSYNRSTSSTTRNHQIVGATVRGNDGENNSNRNSGNSECTDYSLNMPRRKTPKRNSVDSVRNGTWANTTTISNNGTADHTYNNCDDDDSFSALFRNDDNEDYVWGTAAHNRLKLSSHTEQPTKRSRCEIPGEDYSWDDDWNVDPPQVSSASNRSILISNAYGKSVNCSGCHQIAKDLIVKKEGPNKGRRFHVCPKSSSTCNFFQWGDDEQQTVDTKKSYETANFQMSSSSLTDCDTAKMVNSINTSFIKDHEQIVKCHCGNLANRLTVRKEGPNKGRTFYGCVDRSKSCGFFKWTDEDDEQPSTSKGERRGQSNYAWGTTSRQDKTSTSATRNTAQNGENKIRKCGLCRQGGHTRQKCPRRNDIEF